MSYPSYPRSLLSLSLLSLSFLSLLCQGHVVSFFIGAGLGFAFNPTIEKNERKKVKGFRMSAFIFAATLTVLPLVQIMLGS
jgi:hypothetical protein